MKSVIFLVLFLLSFSSSNAQPWRPVNGLICKLEGYSSILLQQVDKDGMAVPFDCKNTDIKVFEGKKLLNHIKPGFHRFCDRITQKKFVNHPSINMPLGVWGPTEGTYDVVVEKDDNIQHFSQIEIKKRKDDPCRIVPIQLVVK